MQLMSGTWAEMRARLALGSDPFDVHNNVLAGVVYLRDLHDRYGWPGALAAYNAGPGRYELYRSAGVPLPPETRAYLARLSVAARGVDGSNVFSLEPQKRVEWTQAPLFVIASYARPSSSTAPAERQYVSAERDADGRSNVSQTAPRMFIGRRSQTAQAQSSAIFVAPSR